MHGAVQNRQGFTRLLAVAGVIIDGALVMMGR